MIPAVAIVEQYPVLLDDINKMIVEYQAIAVVPGDTASYKEARAACTTLVHTRTAIEAKRKDLLRDYRNNVNQVADALLAPLTPVENRLKAELKAEDDRKADIRAEAERVEKERVDAIKASIFKLVNLANAQGKTSEQIIKRIEAIETHETTEQTYSEFMAEAILAKATTLKTLRDALAEREKVEREEAAHKAEAERLEHIFLEQEAESKRFEAECARQVAILNQERLKIEAAEKRLAEEQRKVEAEKVAIEAAKRAEQEAIEKAEQETHDRLKLEMAEAERKVKEEALKPEKEKLIRYFDAIEEIPSPQFRLPAVNNILLQFQTQLKYFAVLAKKLNV